MKCPISPSLTALQESINALKEKPVALLSYGAEESFEDASFRWLLVRQLARESIGTVEYDVASQSGASPKPQKPHLRRPDRRTASS